MATNNLQNLIDQEIERQFKAESPQPVVPAMPSREEWMSRNPGGDYDAAKKARTENPMSVQSDFGSDFQETQRKLKEAEEARQKKTESEKSGYPAIDAVTDFYKSNPSLQPYMESIGGYAAGKVGRSLIPPEMRSGTPEFMNEQNRLEMFKDQYPKAQIAAQGALDTMNLSQNQHEEQLQNLQAQRQEAEEAHRANMQKLNQAQLDHEYHQSLNIDDEINRRMGLTLPNEVDLTLAPKGGKAAFNYAISHGATSPEAMQAESASTVQKENIPSQVETWKKISNIAPEFQQYEESPLLLGREGSKAKTDVLAQEQKLREDLANRKQRIRDDLIASKAEAKINYENQKEIARLSAKAAANARKAHEEHLASSPIKPEHKSAYESAMSTLDELGEKIKSMEPSRLAKIGLTVGRRFVPGLGATVAIPEAEKSAREFHAGNPIRGALFGLGSFGAGLQATDIPPLMGAGDIMQIPAAGLTVYDLLNETEKQKQ
jgi:hypothetical protein